MSRITQSILLFSSRSVTSNGTITSDSINLGRLEYASIHYILADATTSTAVSATARVICAAHPRETFLFPVDTAGGGWGTLCQINSNSSFIGTAIPLTPWGQVQIISSTVNTITFQAVYLVTDELNA